MESIVRSVTGRSSIPRERPLQEVGGGNGEACHWAYWQSVSKATARRGGIFLSRDGKMPARNEKSTLLRIPGNEGDMWSGWVVKGSTADRARGLEDRGEKRWGQNLKWHFFFATVGMSQQLDCHLNVVHRERER